MRYQTGQVNTVEPFGSHHARIELRSDRLFHINDVDLVTCIGQACRIGLVGQNDLRQRIL